MTFITVCTRKKRQMIYIPEINPNSLLLFFERGDSGYAYSLRDYSESNRVTERYAREFPWSANELRDKARFLADAPTVDTKNLAFWHEYTIKGNAYLRDETVLIAQATTSTVSLPPVEQVANGHFPILNAAGLKALRKSAKSGDMERMLNSAQSEDRLTWNLMNLFLMCCPDSWWTQLSAVAKGSNPNLILPLAQGIPHLRFWPVIPAPGAYEAASRERMRGSADPRIVARCKDPKPVEGMSEIDVVIESNSFLIYIEAKLNADISMRTKYDPNRNQIVRNIDCLLESAAGRIPYFWMFVRDTAQPRAYAALMRQYRDRPETLFLELPHRDPLVLRELAHGLVLITWRDIGNEICDINPNDSELLMSVKRELRFRIQ